MKILRNEDLAKILGYTPSALASIKSKTPERLPPTRLIGNTRVWVDEDVDNWIKGLPFSDQERAGVAAGKRRRGRPPKGQAQA